MLKIKLFTHDDLDGVSCAIVANWGFGSENVDVEFCDYKDVNDKVQEFTATMKYKDYDKVFITDISVSKKVADMIEYSVTESEEYLNRYQLLDHHASAKWLNEYEWAYVNNLESGVHHRGNELKKSCASTIFYWWLVSHGISFPVNLMNYIEKVRRYDTWDWTLLGDEEAKQLNDLFWLIGKDRFIERMNDVKNIDPISLFTKNERLLLEIEEDRINEYISKKKKEMFTSSIPGHKVGVVYAEQYISQLGNELAKENPELDFIVLINLGAGTVSYRGIYDHIDLSEIAKQFGGGGHPKASGSTIDPVNRIKYWYSFIQN